MTVTQQAGKEQMLAVLSKSVPHGARWAIRGGESAIDRWLATDSVKDLDLWLHADDLAAFCTAISPHTKGVVSLESDSRWLRHVVFVMSESCGNQLLDISYGDLKVGGALTCPEGQVSTVQGVYGPMLSGVSVVADLVLRKLMRGKLPREDQLAEARCAWLGAPAEVQDSWRDALAKVLGASLMDRVIQLLDGAQPRRWDRAAFVRAAVQASWRQAGVALMIRRRRRLVLGARQRTLYKRPMAPVLLKASGEDEASDLQGLLQELGARNVVKASELTTAHRVLHAGMLGKTVIATSAQMPGLPSMMNLFYGSPLSLNLSQQGTALAQYLAASHRWYIDRPDAAGKFFDADSYNLLPSKSQ